MIFDFRWKTAPGLAEFEPEREAEEGRMIAKQMRAALAVGGDGVAMERGEVHKNRRASRNSACQRSYNVPH